MLPIYFVITVGDVDKDPLDRGCEDFLTLEGAMAYIKTWTNKGYSCRLYKGERVCTI